MSKLDLGFQINSNGYKGEKKNQPSAQFGCKLAGLAVIFSR